MSDRISLVVLAAGEGTRLKLNCPKPLAPLAGQKLIDYSLQTAFNFLDVEVLEGDITLVLGHGIDKINNYINKNYDGLVQSVTQDRQLGTADAVRSYIEKKQKTNRSDYTIVMSSDTPMIKAKDLSELYKVIKKEELDAVAATFIAKDPTGYGRIIQGAEGFHIIEEKDADREIKEIQEVNSALYIFSTSFLESEIKKISNNNASSEFYLTDIFTDKKKVKPVCFENEETFLGINDLHQLQTADQLVKVKHMKDLIEGGVQFIDMRHTYVDVTVEIGKGSCIYPNVFLEGKTEIGEDCVVEPGAIIKSSKLGNGVLIKAYSYLEGSEVLEKAMIGPYGRLRSGSVIGEEAKIGNFVEIKKSKLDKGVKISHLSYVGDAEIGSGTNIGCGFITCNYDGKNKHKTIIGENTFIGSDSQVIAPVQIGSHCFVASGSTINQSMKDGSFAISRGKQMTKENMAKKFLK